MCKMHRLVNQSSPGWRVTREKKAEEVYPNRTLLLRLARILPNRQRAPPVLARALFRSKVDGFVPQTQHVNLRIVSQPGHTVDYEVVTFPSIIREM